MSIVNYFLNTLNIFNPVRKIKPESEQNNDDFTTYIRCLFHDLRGPLNNIFLGIDIVMNSIPKNTENYELLTTVKESCTFLNDSLDGFLNIQTTNDKNYIDMIEIKYEPFNIVGLMNKVKHILIFNAITKKIEINCTVKNVKEWVIGDSKNIQHVIMNLLSNAIKFSSLNSTIQLEIECMNMNNMQQHILITIVDNNPFIEPKIKKKLFTKYNTSDTTKGTGLGLFICKHIIELHKGTIQHHYKGDDSIVGSLKFAKNSTCGNIFQIQLFLEICPSSEKDIYFEKSDESRQPSMNAKKLMNVVNTNKIDMIKCIKSSEIENDSVVDLSVNGHSILKNMKRESVRNIFLDSFHTKDKKIVHMMVVDDSELSRKLLIKLIENNCSNTKVHYAVDGLNALLKIVGFKEKIDQPLNMIFVDNVMPNITGELLSKILRGVGYTGLIIGVTGNGIEKDKQSFIENGADYVFVKPFTQQKLNLLLEFIQREGFESVDGTMIVEIDGKLRRQPLKPSQVT
jgi:CheY-like chemotaxis protein